MICVSYTIMVCFARAYVLISQLCAAVESVDMYTYSSYSLSNPQTLLSLPNAIFFLPSKSNILLLIFLISVA
ncbi:hypothetical protein CC80DRAFT_231720 [Byssothecium circinans]|uniref:Uncharacterized protein n=1 Tax=Byssothecium circinans TaxID=147558 RepID=A0A6A5UBI2_9PLEO|nr:hypothetical protein CC80DRAFT_231720 [Byssothecium circinans]